MIPYPQNTAFVNTTTGMAPEFHATVKYPPTAVSDGPRREESIDEQVQPTVEENKVKDRNTVR
jgi:hypothetical protein